MGPYLKLDNLMKMNERFLMLFLILLLEYLFLEYLLLEYWQSF